MKEGLLDDIRTYGHWRVNIRPVNDPQQKQTLQECFEHVQKSAVSIRGWDYPHISNRNDDQGGQSRMGAYVENWTDWAGIKEFWRMYRSWQFLSYQAVGSDTGVMGEPIPEIPVLHFLDAVYAISEHLEFLKRLYDKGVYADGAQITVSLRNTAGRRLVAGRGRIPFHDPFENGAENIEIRRLLSSGQLSAQHREVALDVMIELFDYFGWNPDRDRLRNEQDNFYNRNFGF